MIKTNLHDKILLNRDLGEEAKGGGKGQRRSRFSVFAYISKTVGRSFRSSIQKM